MKQAISSIPKEKLYPQNSHGLKFRWIRVLMENKVTIATFKFMNESSWILKVCLSGKYCSTIFLNPLWIYWRLTSQMFRFNQKCWYSYFCLGLFKNLKRAQKMFINSKLQNLHREPCISLKTFWKSTEVTFYFGANKILKMILLQCLHWMAYHFCGHNKYSGYHLRIDKALFI